MEGVDLLYPKALDVIFETKGLLPDDTYLEKLKTETAKKLSTFDEHKRYKMFQEWGIQAFLNKSLQNNNNNNFYYDLKVFGLGLLKECHGLSPEIDDFAIDITSKFLGNIGSSDEEPVILQSSSFPDLLVKILSKLPGNHDLFFLVWNDIALQGSDDVSSRSIFWQRSFIRLVVTILAKKSKFSLSITTEEHENVLKELSGMLQVISKKFSQSDSIHMDLISRYCREVLRFSNPLGKIEKVLFPKLLAIIRENLVIDMRTELLISTLDPGLEKFAGLIFKTFEDSSLSLQKMALKLIKFMHFNDSVRTEQMKTIILFFLDHLDVSVECQEEEVQRYRSILIWLSEDLAHCQATGKKFVSLVMKFIKRLCDDEIEVNLQSKEIILSLSKSLDALNLCHDINEFQEVWSVLSNVCIHLEMPDLIKIQAMTVMANAIRKQNQFDYEFDKLFSKKLWTLVGRQNWIVEENFLRLLSVAMNRLKDFDTTDMNYLQNVVMSYTKSRNSFLRAISLAVLAAMTRHPKAWKDFANFDIHEIVDRLLLNESESIVQRNCATFVCKYFSEELFSIHVGHEIRQKMMAALQITDCEAKKEVFRFWKNQMLEVKFDNDPKSYLDALIEAEIGTALAMCMSDYEKDFLADVYPVIHDLKLKLPEEWIEVVHPAKRLKIEDKNVCDTSDNKYKVDDLDDEDRETVLEEVVDMNDENIIQRGMTRSCKHNRKIQSYPTLNARDFLSKLAEFDVQRVKEIVTSFAEIHIGLNSILVDIIQSSIGISMMGEIDCI